MVAKAKVRLVHHQLYRLAERQGGYFSARQAQAIGLTRSLLSYHAKSGHLKRIQRGIYRLAEFPQVPFADLYVAWLAAGPHAVVSHESALAVYDLSDVLPAAVHITVPRTVSRRSKRMRLHTSHLRASEVTQRAGLPVTTVARTLADLARTGYDGEQLGLAVSQALERGLVAHDALEKYASREADAQAG